MKHKNLVSTGGAEFGRHLVWGLLVLPILFSSALIAGDVPQGNGFELNGAVLGQAATTSSGGAFQVKSRQVIPGEESEEFTLRKGKSGNETNATGCPCQDDALFADGFESGSIDAWSSSVGN